MKQSRCIKNRSGAPRPQCISQILKVVGVSIAPRYKIASIRPLKQCDPRLWPHATWRLRKPSRRETSNQITRQSVPCNQMYLGATMKASQAVAGKAFRSRNVTRCRPSYTARYVRKRGPLRLPMRHSRFHGDISKGLSLPRLLDGRMVPSTTK